MTYNAGKLLTISVISQSHFVLLKQDTEGGGGAVLLVLGLLFRIWAELKSNGHNSTRNGFYDL